MINLSKNPQKIIVIGASGNLGKRLLEKACKKYSCIGTSSRGEHNLMLLDLQNPGNFVKDNVRPGDMVIITAAISAPDICANEHKYAFNVNVTGTSKLIGDSLAAGAKVLFFSSDMVYGEKENYFDEGLACDPVGEYAIMKHDIERKYVDCTSFKSIRLSYVFSKDDKFTSYLINCENRQVEAEVFHPFYRSVIYRDDVVDGVLGLVEKWDQIIERNINFGGAELISRADFASLLVGLKLINLRLRISNPPSNFFEKRPRTIAMRSNLLTTLIGRPPVNLSDAIKIEFDI